MPGAKGSQCFWCCVAAELEDLDCGCGPWLTPAKACDACRDEVVRSAALRFARRVLEGA